MTPKNLWRRKNEDEAAIFPREQARKLHHASEGLVDQTNGDREVV